ncbi:MAG: amidohydrolase family protein [Telluria sp.]
MRSQLFWGCLVAACVLGQASAAQPGSLVLAGGTLVDLEHGGASSHDVPDSVVVIRDGVIIEAGPRSTMVLPPDLPVLDVRGTFLIPGLVDGFGSMRAENFARVYLYNGVTAVHVNVGSPDDEGERTLVEPQRGPHVLRGRAVPAGRAVPSDAGGLRIVELTKDLDTAAAARVGRWARRQGVGVTAILGRMPLAGMNSARPHVLLRNDHYLTSLAGADAQAAYAAAPRSKAAGPAYRAACNADPDGPAVAALAAQLRAQGTALMPMLSVEATADDLGIANPWRAASAVVLRPSDVDDPVDPVTGSHPFLEQHAERREVLQACARRRQQVDSALHRLGVRYLAGSGSPAYGVLPGSGLRQELALLRDIGLTPREAVAAATTGFADVFGWRDVGRLAAGYRGDLLVLKRNPALDLGALDDPAALIYDGVPIDRRTLLEPTIDHPMETR